VHIRTHASLDTCVYTRRCSGGDRGASRPEEARLSRANSPLLSRRDGHPRSRKRREARPPSISRFYRIPALLEFPRVVETTRSRGRIRGGRSVLARVRPHPHRDSLSFSLSLSCSPHVYLSVFVHSRDAHDRDSRFTLKIVAQESSVSRLRILAISYKR